MHSILDSPFEEQEPYTLWWFFLLEVILIAGAESLWQFVGPQTQWLIIPLIILLGFHIIFQIIAPFYKQPNFDTHPLWVILIGAGYIILLAGIMYHFFNWPNADETLSTGVFVLIAAHLFIPLINTLREPKPFMIIAPLWLMFISMAFGLSASLYYGMGWRQDPRLLSAGLVVSGLNSILFILLLYFNWKEYKYLLYYLPRLFWLSWVCSNTLFIQPLENPIELPF